MFFDEVCLLKSVLQGLQESYQPFSLCYDIVRCLVGDDLEHDTYIAKMWVVDCGLWIQNCVLQSCIRSNYTTHFDGNGPQKGDISTHHHAMRVLRARVASSSTNAITTRPGKDWVLSLSSLL